MGEQQVIRTIQRNPQKFPLLTTAINAIRLVSPLKNIFDKLEKAYTGGRTHIFKGIRNCFIQEWGQNHNKDNLKYCQDLFKLSERRINQIINKNDMTHQKLRDTLEPGPPKIRLLEDTNLWVKVLDSHLKKKSGERGESTLRSPYSKAELYDLFKKGWYGQALDQQILANPSLVTEAQDSKKPTRFQRNILALQKYKAEKGKPSYSCDPLKDPIHFSKL